MYSGFILYLFDKHWQNAQHVPATAFVVGSAKVDTTQSLSLWNL